MAKNKILDPFQPVVNVVMEDKMPGHGLERARSRKEALQTYSGWEIKNDEQDRFNFDRVESMYSSFYAGIDPRRRKEMAEGGMIKEDNMAFANCPSEPIHREYPRAGYYTNPYIDDTMKD